MYFQPNVGTGGYLGWLVLQRTETVQRETFEQSPALERDIDYFRENIANATTAKDLVSDRRLLAVALGAFGLGDEIDKRAFIEKILDEGTESEESFANRLNDSRFSAMAETFGYGNTETTVDIASDEFREDIIARFKSLEFERAVGENDNDLRLALNFRREAAEFGASDSSERTVWFQIMGRQPVRELIATALNIPSEVSQLDVDRQQEIFAEKAQDFFGSSDASIFADGEVVNEILRRFFINRQLETGPSPQTPGYAALTLLQSSGLGGASAENLILSQTGAL